MLGHYFCAAIPEVCIFIFRKQWMFIFRMHFFQRFKIISSFFFFLNKLHLSVIKRIGSASLCGIQIIYGLNSQPLEYILSMAVHFLPQKIYIVFVYMNSNTFWMLPANALYSSVYVTFYMLMIYI